MLMPLTLYALFSPRRHYTPSLLMPAATPDTDAFAAATRHVYYMPLAAAAAAAMLMLLIFALLRLPPLF